MADWREIADDKSKYQSYLCSPEWGQLRRKVRKRAGGKCERCRYNEMTAVHHLTYERKYAEHLDDLQAICKGCHDFTHGHSDVDPKAADKHWINYVGECDMEGVLFIPYGVFFGVLTPAMHMVDFAMEQSRHLYEAFEKSRGRDTHATSIENYQMDWDNTTEELARKLDALGYWLWRCHGCPRPNTPSFWYELSNTTVPVVVIESEKWALRHFREQPENRYENELTF